MCVQKAITRSDRPEGYRYFDIISNHLDNDLSQIFNGKLVYPRQVEIHLPGDHERACNFECYNCQGRLLEQPLAHFEEDALEIVDQLRGRVPYFIYGGAYTEPLLNPYLLDFLKMTKRHGSYFGIHTNGSLLLTLEEKESLLSWLCWIATSGRDYLSISLDAGTPESHRKSKSTKKNWFDEIIEGIRAIAKIRGTADKSAIRVCYLLNTFNSSEREIGHIIEIMREIKVDSLRFSIPYDLYGKDFEAVRRYKQAVEVDNEYEEMLRPLMSKDLSERPYIFYLPPECQDVDRMNFKQCIYGYYQITMASDGHVYKCSSTASPTFKMNRLGRVTSDIVEFNRMILANHDPDFDASTCFKVGARCNRIALTCNLEWSKRQ
jgi:MoaA/NifB/PqqE/SkfB family radical SAM enzyme